MRSVGSGVVNEMRSKFRCSYTFFFCLFVSTTAILAQDLPDVALGLQPYVSYHGGGLDNVSTLNGSLTVKIPLLSYPQKGSSLTLSYSVIFNSFGYQEVDNCIAVPDPDGSDDTIPLHNGCMASIQYLPAGLRNSSEGPQVVVDQSLRVAGNREAESVQVTNPPVQGRYFIVTPDLAQHPLGRAADGTFRSVDESGYSFISPSPTNYPASLGVPDPNRPSDSNSYVIASASTAGGTITDSHGNVYTGSSITDPDGNAINFSSDMSSDALSFTVTDSTNRTIPAATATDRSRCPTLPDAASQPLVSASIWTIPGSGSGGMISYIFCYAKVTISTNFTADVASQNFHQPIRTPTMLQSIVLPNQQFWGFIYYDSTNLGTNPTGASGQLMKLIYPTHGSVAYTYAQFGGFCPTNRISGLNPQGIGVQLYANEVASRTMTDADGTVLGSWNYSYGDFEPGVFTTTGSIVSPPSVLSPSGDITITKFQLDPNSATESDLSCQYFDAGKKVYQGNSPTGTPLLETSITYQFLNPSGLPAVSVPREQVITTTLNGVSSTVTKQYDPGISFAEETCTFDGLTCGADNPFTESIGGPILTTYTDFSGAVLKQESTAYQWKQTQGDSMPYLTANLLDIPSATQIQDGSGYVVASTTYAYDDPSYSPGGQRGHVTTTTSVLNTGASPTTHTGWNGAGQKIYIIDADGHINSATGHTVDYQYSRCNYSYLSGATNALNQSTSGGYDCNTGLLTSFTDANLQTSTFSYDPMNRILTASYPDGGGTTFNYDDSINTVQRSILATPDPTETTTVVFDGFGREIHRLMSDLPSDDTVDTTYDLNGRVSSVSNPYRSTGDSTYGITNYVYDALGRKTLETEADGTSQLAWNYSQAPTVKSTDEDGNSWFRTTDALGRLTGVVEPNGASTAYSYNPQGDLLNITQPGIAGETARSTRTFRYDSLSRLVAASNPETSSSANPASLTCVPGGPWSTCYTYDLNGNLLTKTDNRNITISYSYDGLNRLVAKTYSGVGTGSVTAATTLSSCFQFDTSSFAIGPRNFIGRLTSEWTQSGSCPATIPAAGYKTMRSILAYDQMGRVKTEQQCNVGTCITRLPYTATSSYDLAGREITYTNGLQSLSFTKSYDLAGRLRTAMKDAFENIPQDPLISIGNYNPAGAIQNMTLGFDTVVTKTYDSRLRPTSETATHP